MPRRNNGEGTVRQRKDGLWEIRLSFGRGSDGKPQRRSVYGKTKRERLEKARDLQHNFNAGRLSFDREPTVGEHLAAWLEQKALEVQPRTISNYRKDVRLYIEPRLGSTPIGDIIIGSLVAALAAGIIRDLA